jgi:hypothetical protein
MRPLVKPFAIAAKICSKRWRGWRLWHQDALQDGGSGGSHKPTHACVM